MAESRDRALQTLSTLPRSELTRVRDDEIDAFYVPDPTAAQKGAGPGRSQ